MTRMLPSECGKEPLLGWRAWKLRMNGPGSFVLRPAVYDTAGWTPRVPSVSACSRQPHAAPDERCGCGLHALREARMLRRLRWRGTVVGTVALWGRVIEHRRGYRAQFAYPQRLKLVCTECLRQGRVSSYRCVTMLALEKQYQKVGSEVIAVCARHRRSRGATELTVSPREVQAALLSEYAVDLVPAGSLEALYGRLERLTGRIAGPIRIFARIAPVLAGILLVSWLVLVGIRGPSHVVGATSDRTVTLQDLASQAAASAWPVHLSMEAMRLLRNVCIQPRAAHFDERCAQIQLMVPTLGNRPPPCPVSGSRNMALVLVCFQRLARSPG